MWQRWCAELAVVAIELTIRAMPGGHYVRLRPAQPHTGQETAIDAPLTDRHALQEAPSSGKRRL